MNNEIIKISRQIINILINYILNEDGESFDLSYKVVNEEIKINLKSKLDNEPKDIDKINSLFNQEKNSVFETYYSNLLDLSGNTIVDINMLGTIIDKGNIRYKDGILCIDISIKS